VQYQSTGRRALEEFGQLDAKRVVVRAVTGVAGNASTATQGWLEHVKGDELRRSQVDAVCERGMLPPLDPANMVRIEADSGGARGYAAIAADQVLCDATT
jgi:hypothetical protein